MPDFSPAPPELRARIDRLIAAYRPQLADARIELQTRAKAPTASGAITWGETDTADNTGEERQFDFTIWFAADVWAGLSEIERDAIALHELSHCGYDEAGKPQLIVHDIEEFNLVLAVYGFWWPGAQATLAAMQQGLQARPEGKDIMPGYGAYQRPMPGNHGSTGAFAVPMPGNHGSTGAYGLPGNHGSTGAFDQGVAWSDPMLEPGGDYYMIDIGGGRVIELSPAAYQAAVQSIMADMQSAPQTPQPGNHGSTGA